MTGRVPLASIASVTENEQIWMNKWAAKRKAGMLNYLLKDGLLFFGVPMFGFLCLMNMVFFLVSDGSPAPLWLYFGIALIGGILWSIKFWFISERNYESRLKNWDNS